MDKLKTNTFNKESNKLFSNITLLIIFINTSIYAYFKFIGVFLIFNEENNNNNNNDNNNKIDKIRYGAIFMIISLLLIFVNYYIYYKNIKNDFIKVCVWLTFILTIYMIVEYKDEIKRIINM